MKCLQKSEYRVEPMLRECRPRPSAAFLRTHAEEVRAPGPLDARLIDQLEIGFVHQLRRA